MVDCLGGFEPLQMSKQAFWKRVNPQAIAFLLNSLATSLQLIRIRLRHEISTWWRFFPNWPAIGTGNLLFEKDREKRRLGRFHGVGLTQKPAEPEWGTDRF